jgi:hypothetical protein
MEDFFANVQSNLLHLLLLFGDDYALILLFQTFFLESAATVVQRKK